MDRQKIKRVGLTTLGVLGVMGLVSFGWVWVAPCWLGGCAPVAELSDYQAEGSELLDINDEPIGTLATVNRRIISLDSLPEYLPQAFVAIEDRRFYDHGGLDFRRVFGALLSNVRAGGVAEGGSTITMQLARNLFPDWLPYTERSMTRKLKEARVARQIERSFSKDKILELYLNHIYLGNGAYGVEAAAQSYFGKSAAELTLAEAAVLGGLPKAPSNLDPTENPEGAVERRDLVLAQMADAGFITAAEAQQATDSRLQLARASADPDQPHGSYFVERVRREMRELAGNQFYTAGLKIYTTLDREAQQASEEELARQLDAIESGTFGSFPHPTYPEARGEVGDAGQTTYLQGAIVMMDAATGEIRALVGGRDFDDSNFDRAIQAERQAGSAFKPFVYLTALELYGTPAHQVEDAPVRMVLSDGQVWEPRNYTGEYEGTMTLRDALARSKNSVTVRVAQDVGMDPIIARAHELGISSDIPNVPAAALGASDVRPIEVVQAYAAFANGGYRVEPHFIRKIVDRRGNTVWEGTAVRRQVIDSESAFVLTSMLRDVVDRGTGTGVRAVGFTGPAAGKTGTTNSATDVWFVGYTPELVTAVWMGFDEPKTILRGASGGTLAAPAWGRLMRRVYADRESSPWPEPAGMTTASVELGTGFVVSADCPARGPTYQEYFLRGGPSSSICTTRDPYGYLAPSDSGWYDEEWSLDPIYPDTFSTGDVAPGIEWPELEAIRRGSEAPARRSESNFPPSTEFPSRQNVPPPSSSTPPPTRAPPPAVESTPAPPVESAPAEQLPGTPVDTASAAPTPAASPTTFR